MRIISGEFRRRKLHANAGQTTRPITDRAKECLFSNIEWRLPGARVADVFCGTGSLGLEAVSRGAVTATFLEQDRDALELLRKNIAECGAEDRSLVWPSDIPRCSWKPRNAEAFTPWTVIFLDPPYRMAEDLKPGKHLWKSLQRMARTGVAADDALLIFRTSKHAKFQFPSEWVAQEPLSVTSMTMHLYVKAASADGPADGSVPPGVALSQSESPVASAATDNAAPPH